jgi:hypothetical protein
MTTHELEVSRRVQVEATFAQSLQEHEVQMAERAEEPKERDYSCEIISFVVLVILSELSHFWYIMIAICIAVLFWGAIVLLGQLAVLAASTFSWRPRARRANDGRADDSGNQVFQPSKIRQSVDCWIHRERPRWTRPGDV